jgi:hypothetical protein
LKKSIFIFFLVFHMKSFGMFHGNEDALEFANEIINRPNITNVELHLSGYAVRATVTWIEKVPSPNPTPETFGEMQDLIDYHDTESYIKYKDKLAGAKK